MIKVIRYLQHIHSHDDLRVENDKIFQLKKILNSNIDCFIKYYNFDVISDDEDDDDDVDIMRNYDLNNESHIQNVDILDHNISNDESVIMKHMNHHTTTQ